MSNRTIRSLGVLIAVLIAAWGITQYSTAKRTTRYLDDLSLQDPGKVMDALSELRQRGPSIGPRLAAIVQAQTADAAPRAAWLLGLVGSHAGDAVLKEALNSKDDALQLAAIEALGHLQVATAQGPLSALLGDKDEKTPVRLAAAKALGFIGDDGAVAALASALNSRPGVAAAAEETKAEVAAATPDLQPGQPLAASGLRTLSPLDEDVPPLRLAAAKALAGTGHQFGLDALAKALDPKVEPDVEVRVAAAYALGDAGALAHDEAGATTAVNGLLTALKDEVGDVRIASIYALGKLRVPATLKPQVAEAVAIAKTDKHYWARLAAASTARSLGVVQTH